MAVGRFISIFAVVIVISDIAMAIVASSPSLLIHHPPHQTGLHGNLPHQHITSRIPNANDSDGPPPVAVDGFIHAESGRPQRTAEINNDGLRSHMTDSTRPTNGDMIDTNVPPPNYHRFRGNELPTLPLAARFDAADKDEGDNRRPYDRTPTDGQGQGHSQSRDEHIGQGQVQGQTGRGQLGRGEGQGGFNGLSDPSSLHREENRRSDRNPDGESNASRVRVLRQGLSYQPYIAPTVASTYGSYGNGNSRYPNIAHGHHRPWSSSYAPHSSYSYFAGASRPYQQSGYQQPLNHGPYQASAYTSYARIPPHRQPSGNYAPAASYHRGVNTYSPPRPVASYQSYSGAGNYHGHRAVTSATYHCPPVKGEFCNNREAGHYPHTASQRCFVQCDQYGRSFVSACAGHTLWRYNKELIQQLGCVIASVTTEYTDPDQLVADKDALNLELGELRHDMALYIGATSIGIFLIVFFCVLAYLLQRLQNQSQTKPSGTKRLTTMDQLPTASSAHVTESRDRNAPITTEVRRIGDYSTTKKKQSKKPVPRVLFSNINNENDQKITIFARE